MNYFHFSRTAKRFAILVALLGVLGTAAIAFAASGPPAPTITAAPARFTSSTSASFSFADAQKGVKFVCSRDGAGYTPCASPISYAGFAGGSHTFAVEAVDSSGHSGAATVYTWQIVLTPPSVALTFPGNGHVNNATGWNAGCAQGRGVCGTASDPSGVSSAVVSIQQASTGRYWNGSSYSSSTELYEPASLTASSSSGATWFYRLPLPSPDGSYTVHVRATDGVGISTPSSSPTTSTFTIDTTPPPAPSIVTKPLTLTNQTSASFTFSDVGSDVSYRCSLDGGSYVGCTSPRTYPGLRQGWHYFSVVAIDTAGNVSSTTSYWWAIDTTPPNPPTITVHPVNPSTSTTATFAFTEAGPDGDGYGGHRDAGDHRGGGAFQCQLGSGGWVACGSPQTYTGLSAGSQTFRVRVVDAAGNVSTAASFNWTIQQSAGMPFTISGNAAASLYPGAAAEALVVKLTNPNSVPIFVTSLTATLSNTGLPAGCGTSNFTIAQATIPSSGVAVPADGSLTLPAGGATAPAIAMLDTKTNQDACEKATLTITYAGSAHS